MEALPICTTCRHEWYWHRETREWRLNNPRVKNASGCSKTDCKCDALVMARVL